jgi:hypothetical protein
VPNASEVQITRPSNVLVKWVAIAGLIVIVKGIMVGISGLVRLAKEEVRLRIGY